MFDFEGLLSHGNVPLIIAIIVAAYFCKAIAGVMKAVMDTLQFHYDSSPFKKFASVQQWWDPKISHTNKYKNGRKEDGPKYFGSTTFFVWITDAWHFFQFMQNNFNMLYETLLLWMIVPFWIAAIATVVARTISAVSFETVFRNLED